MKKILIGLAALTLMLGSCTKENTEKAGSIQGMGNTSGNFEVKAPFTLPQGISVLGDITGLPKAGTKGGDSKSTAYSCYGSGGKMIKLKVTLLNRNDNQRTIFFPKGLLWKCDDAGYQDAICLQTTWVCLKANSQRTITLDLYCINYGRTTSDNFAYYRFVGVTSSPIFNSLFKMIGWKMINYEWINPNPAKSDAVAGPTYDQITERMQNIVWNLTNIGKDVSDDDKAFIESIPELSATEIPVVDSQSQFPEYFEELIVSGL
jgi:hypothetical protein